MAKFHCNVYYQYVFSVNVEAENQDEAYDKAYQLADAACTEDLEYVGYNGGNIAEIVNGEIDFTTQRDMG